MYLKDIIRERIDMNMNYETQYYKGIPLKLIHRKYKI